MLGNMVRLVVIPKLANSLCIACSMACWSGLGVPLTPITRENWVPFGVYQSPFLNVNPALVRSCAALVVLVG